MKEKAYLVLQNGRVFEGRRFGANGDVFGEAVFTTAMTGYVEALNDPSFHKQLVVQTFPEIGNVGVMEEDFESAAPQLSGYIVREYCDTPSNFRCEKTLGQYMQEHGVVGISGVDTRAITRALRSNGVMNACILSELPENMEALLEKLAAWKDEGSVEEVSSKCATLEMLHKPVVLMDFGHKASLRHSIENRGLPVKVVHANTAPEEILAMDPRGILVSNGPGDPMVNVEAINTIRVLMEQKIPMLGIGLGHQLMALAMGAISRKMKFGHRGENQSVMEMKSGKLYSTSQNHGYVIETESLPENAKPLYVNINDNTLEGIEYTDRPAFSVQFYPGFAGGPRETDFIFDDFAKLIEGGDNECR